MVGTMQMSASRSCHLSVYWWCMEDSLGLRPPSGLLHQGGGGEGGVGTPGVDARSGSNNCFAVITCTMSCSLQLNDVGHSLSQE